MNHLVRSCSLLILMISMPGAAFAQGTAWEKIDLPFRGPIDVLYVDTVEHALYVAGTALDSATWRTYFPMVRIDTAGNITQLPPTPTTVSSICRWRGQLYVAGDRVFAYVNGHWDPVPVGYWMGAYTLCPHREVLLIGGHFSVPTDPGIPEETTLLSYNGSTAVPFAGIDSVIDPQKGAIYAIVSYDSTLVVSGKFTPGPGHNPGFLNVAKWNDTAWLPMQGGIPSPSYIGVRTLRVHKQTLYAAGDFTFFGGAPGEYIAAWDGSDWLPLSTHASKPSGQVRDVQFQGDTMLVGGHFLSIDGAPSNFFARYYNGMWCYNSEPMASDPVITVVDFYGKVIAGGFFEVVADSNIEYFARILTGNTCFPPTAIQRQGVGGDFQISPNPAQNVLNISWKADPGGNIDYSVYDITGKLLLEDSSSSRAKALNINRLPPGLLLLQVEGMGHRLRLRFVKAGA